MTDAALQLDALPSDGPVGMAFFDRALACLRGNRTFAALGEGGPDDTPAQAGARVVSRFPALAAALVRARDRGLAQTVALHAAPDGRSWTAAAFPDAAPDGAPGLRVVVLEAPRADEAGGAHAEHHARESDEMKQRAHRADEALRERAALLHAVSDASTDVIFAKDREGRLLLANPATLALVGKPAEAVLGKTDAEFLEDKEAARQVMENDRRIMDGGVASEVEEVVPLPDGTRRVWWSRKTPYRDADGKVVALLGISRDVTARKQAEEALRESEQRFRSLFTHMTEGFALGEALCDGAGAPCDFRFLEMNEAFERQSGLRRADVAGRPMRSVLPQLEQSWVDAYCGVALSGEPRRFENYNRDLDRHFSVFCYSPARGRFAIVFTDVTERRRGEDALRRTEEQYRTLAENSPEVIARFDRHLRHMYVNAYGARLYGVPVPRVVGRTHAELGMPADKVAHWRRHMEEVFATGRSCTVDFELDSPHLGHRFFSSLFVPERNAAGEVTSVLAITRDVTERQLAEERAARTLEALNVERDKLAAVIRELPVGVGLMDSRGNTLLMNDAGLRMHGFASEADMVANGEKYAQQFELRRVDGTPLPSDEWPAARALRGEYFTGCEVVLRNRLAGTERIVSYSVQPVRGAADTRLLVYVMRDVTERRRNEEALRHANERLREADRRKDEFLGMLSHELRNPLAPIRNCIHVLNHPGAGAEQLRRARTVIQRQTDHLTRLVDDLLDVTRIARGKVELRRERVDLAELTRRSAEDHRSVLADAGVKLVVEAPDERLEADADATRLAQVVGNLLQNAGKFTPGGGVVTLSVAAAGEGVAEIRVRDTGLGIEPTLLPLVFEPFVQSDQSLARSRGGLGLGLALVRGIVELHGGRVRAESDGPGKGALFVVTLPLVAQPAMQPGPAPEAATGTRGRRVLVVDDNVDAAESLAQLIELFGHATDVAHDGRGALAKARSFRPDVVLCDIGLPGMNGYEVARRLRQEQGARDDMQIFAVSGYARPDDLARALEAGFDGHISKPPDPGRIERLLAE